MSAKKSTTSKRKRASMPTKAAPRAIVTANPGDVPADYRRSDYEAKQAAYETSEKWVEFAQAELRAGREIPFQDVAISQTGDIGRASVARTDALYRRATRSVFAVPDLPWKRAKES